MTVQGKHRILLVNFSERDAGGLTKAGFNVELGYVGMLEKRGQKDLLPYYFPHPARRPRLYAGDSEEIVQAAKDQDIGLLSTVELYKIAIAVKNGVMSRMA